jgi:sugar lactone lactonase YvrE
MVALQHGFASFDTDKKQAQPVYVVKREALEQIEGNRFNGVALVVCEPETLADGKCDPSGRFWAGTMHIDEPNGYGKGAVYMLDHQLKAHKMFGPVSISNGIVWTSDKKTMCVLHAHRLASVNLVCRYYIDTSDKREVQRFDYDDKTGQVCVLNCSAVISIAPPGVEWECGVLHWQGGRLSGA